MLQSLYENVKLKGVLEWRRNEDRKYLMSLKPENLLLPYYLEAGLTRITYIPKDLHGGWDSPLSQIRGTVCSHWLSSAALIYSETGDMELRSRADYIVNEIARCQKENGGEWCFSIPEKYLLWLKQGKRTWAPQYVCHKTMMGLLDMYRLTGNKQALEIVEKAADWFLRYTQDITVEQMAQMMWEETGGLMELFADLYSVTKDPNHLLLAKRYERTDLFNLLETDENPLVNMHANSTVPEIMGAARVYEITGEERYRRLVKRYWDLAVNKSGMFATGGQTSGEAWTPEGQHAHRLSNTNQEHCLVYNMMRLADYLFRWTGDSVYADYWERNLYNGIFAQGFWKEDKWEAVGVDPRELGYGYVAYYLPLHAGAKKAWGSRTQDFWCCHNTLMQANASFHQALYYLEKNKIVIAQYQDSCAELSLEDKTIRIEQRTDSCTGEIIRIEKVNREVVNRPEYQKMLVEITCDMEASFELALRVPSWLSDRMIVMIDGERVDYCVDEHGFAVLNRNWLHNTIEITLPKTITTWPLPDQPDMVAFLDGPVTLVGMTDEERTLYYKEKPEEILVPYDERRWALWLKGWKTINQPVNFVFKPIYQVGYETYTTYFPVKKMK